MFKKQSIFLSLILSVIAFKGFSQQSVPLSLKMKNVGFTFNLNAQGTPVYQISYGKNEAVKSSVLGFKLDQGISLAENFKLLKADSVTVDETWKPVWGEVAQIRNHYKQLTVHLVQQGQKSILLDIVFRIFEDGLGFRYEFPVQENLKSFVVKEELTAFNMTGDHKTFWIPADFDSNEYKYTSSPLSAIDARKWGLISSGTIEGNIPDQSAVQTPLMMKAANGLYINIHEAALIDYPSMQLHVDKSTFGLSSSLVPDARGNKAYMRTPFHTPWRTVIVSDKATDILSSKMILNLNEPSKIENTSWIKPMKFMGVWWEMQVGRTSWNYTDQMETLHGEGKYVPNGRHAANTENVKHYIDFASKNGIEGLLVEGWNKGWEEWTDDKEEKFDFVTPYPDFDVKAVSDYAKAKNVKMIMHNETGGSATSYERQMDTAFRFMNRYGYGSLKTGYVSGIVPRGEHHDGQWMVNHYIRSIKKAADHHVMIDIHEPTRPTGLHRTYPNFMASEAGRGNEWNFFSDGNPPEHETILPFTRLIGGPMDYTPGIFKLRDYAPGVPERQMHSTLAKQLALYITMYSPLQMAADIPENYSAHMDAFRFIQDVAVDWDDTRIVEAEPGEYITIARKAKGKNEWFLGAITNGEKRETVVKLDFLDKNQIYTATIYADGKDAEWKTNPENYQIKTIKVTAKSVLKLMLAPGGGAAVHFRLLTNPKL
ncbi:glycoside hydrolase family 97 protein [Pedobacter frigidisoli]|uniref:Glycoside hydrolase family 97 protein n=1 Tax=Pedobacter frigidisoli TaxID=2530455 RepID=A0A4R0NW48_9SPHI|nr:glycoside hydrolase family 97 protein [Pedobacter frigidisoli]TCD05910.1 glycoside hydrolase family 97 protein [Pedobacter frigidisoli]